MMLFAQRMTEINPTAKHSNITQVAQEQKLSARIGTRLDHKENYEIKSNLRIKYQPRK